MTTRELLALVPCLEMRTGLAGLPDGPVGKLLEEYFTADAKGRAEIESIYTQHGGLAGVLELRGRVAACMAKRISASARN